jgi:urease accessory protein
VPPPLADVGSRGRLDLTFGLSGGRTILRRSYCEVPFKITRLQDPGLAGIAHLIVMQSTAGLFGGDAVAMTVHVERGARVLITQQSATKAHPSLGRLAVQTQSVRVDSEGELWLHLEPLIPFAGARVEQRMSIDVAGGARFSYWEALMAGRVGRGEAWRFEALSSETRLAVDGRLRYLDRYTLAPNAHPVNGAWTMADAQYLGTGLCCDERAEALAQRLHEALPDAGVAVPEPGLLAVRVAARDGVAYHRARDIVCGALRG